jgi:hypothetical protein
VESDHPAGHANVDVDASGARTGAIALAPQAAHRSSSADVPPASRVAAEAASAPRPGHLRGLPRMIEFRLHGDHSPHLADPLRHADVSGKRRSIRPRGSRRPKTEGSGWAMLEGLPNSTNRREQDSAGEQERTDGRDRGLRTRL